VVVPSVDQEVFEGDDPIQQVVVTADVTGNLASLNGATVYVVVEDAQQLFASTAEVTLGQGGLGNTLTISGRTPNSQVGDFNGSLIVNVCLDLACTKPFQGSPFGIPYHVKVIPGLKLARTDLIALTSTFPASSTPWVSQVVLPQGATSFVSMLGGAAFDLVAGTDTVTITGKPAAVGRYDDFLYLAAVGVTSRGRSIQLTLTTPLSYTVAGTGQFQILYSPPQLDLSVTLTDQTSYPVVAYIDSLAANGKAYWSPNRIDYLPGDGVTTGDANGVVWLTLQGFGPGDRFGGQLWTGYFGLAANPCNLSSSGFVCLAPGLYDALVYPSTGNGSGTYEESPTPVRVRLTVKP
jgi:hypothetical protein